jgi:hypothetical protein
MQLALSRFEKLMQQTGMRHRNCPISSISWSIEARWNILKQLPRGGGGWNSAQWQYVHPLPIGASVIQIFEASKGLLHWWQTTTRTVIECNWLSTAIAEIL